MVCLDYTSNPFYMLTSPEVVTDNQPVPDHLEVVDG